MTCHPLAADAIDTLVALRNQALTLRNVAERQLEDEDRLPRGRLPVLDRIAAHETRALHLRVAIEALGGALADAPFEAIERDVREASMPERRPVELARAA